MNTPVKNAGSDAGSRFNYLVCLDIVVVACILVVAGRPDGLAITISAVIVAACALVYRCSLGIRSYTASKSRAPTPPSPDVDRKFSPPTYTAPTENTPDRASRSKSWLRESD
jgi:hypothetical protein